MSLVPYITDSPLPEMDCAPMIALGIAFAIATNLFNHIDSSHSHSESNESNEEICDSTENTSPPPQKHCVDVGVQTDPLPLPPPIPLPVTPRANTSWSVTPPKSYVPKSQFSNKNIDKDIIAILTASSKPLTYKDILSFLKRSTTHGLLYANMTKHDMNVHLYMMLNDKLVKKISENPSECPTWTLP